jgi:hypothetical protein
LLSREEIGWVTEQEEVLPEISHEAAINFHDLLSGYSNMILGNYAMYLGGRVIKTLSVHR